MAELSQRDKDILLSEGAARDERIDALAEDQNTPEVKIKAAQEQKVTASFVAITGVALLIGGWFLNGPTLGFEKGLGLVLVSVSALWYIYLRVTIKRLRALVVE